MAHNFQSGDRVIVVKGEFMGCEGWISQRSPITSIYSVLLDGDLWITRIFNADDLILDDYMPDSESGFQGSIVTVLDKRRRHQ